MYLVALTAFQRAALRELLERERPEIPHLSPTRDAVEQILGLLAGAEEVDEAEAERRISLGLDTEARLDWPWIEQLRVELGDGWSDADVVAIAMAAKSRRLWQPRSTD